MTTIAAAVADLDIQDLEIGAKANDQVENFGQYEGVDNMTGDLYDSLRHRELLRSLDCNVKRNLAQRDAVIPAGLVQKRKEFLLISHLGMRRRLSTAG